MTTLIRDTWLAHPEYWFATGPDQKRIDQILYDLFRTYDPTAEDTLGIVIYMDQLIRHFSRVEPMTEEFILECRVTAARLVTWLGPAFINEVSAEELVWYLMPWKHLKEWTPLFRQIDSWLSTRKRPLTDFPGLNRFFMDSYRKAYATVTPCLLVSSPYDPAAICESHPPTYTGDETLWRSLCLPLEVKPLMEALPSKGAVTISLSGGVDSMLMAALLVRKGLDTTAAHIVYGNRRESEAEANFVATYCQKLGIPLYVYRVEWLRRDSVDRAFYEEMTRQLRFSVYRAVESERPVYLGHIQEDAVENVWTNFAHGSHLEDLIKFQAVAVENGVTICRPWLRTKKQTIYEIAAALAIPHLKNTTPLWSNRGKFRTAFYAATHAQYGASVDAKVLEVAGRLKAQAALLDRLLYQPILITWTADRHLNVTLAVQNDLGAEGWDHLLTHVAHTHLGIPKPRFATVADFVLRLRRRPQRIALRKDFVVTVLQKGAETWLSF